MANGKTTVLLASGFNGLAQIRNLSPDHFSFTPIAYGEDVQLISCSWSSVAYSRNGTFHIQGNGVPINQDVAIEHESFPWRDVDIHRWSDRVHRKGTIEGMPRFNTPCHEEVPKITSHDGIHSIIHREGDSLIRIDRDNYRADVLQKASRLVRTDERVEHVAANATGQVACITFLPTKSPESHACKSHRLRFFETKTHLEDWYAEGSQTSGMLEENPDDMTWPCEVSGHPVGLVASSTSFALLTVKGLVYTWGSALRPAVLGRQINAGGDYRTPEIVQDLLGTPVKKISACNGGQMMGALTEAGEAYLWGEASVLKTDVVNLTAADGEIGQGASRITQSLAALDNVDKDSHIGKIEFSAVLGDEEAPGITDLAVGDGHVVLLDDVNRIWVAGSNDCGQLGLQRPPSKGTVMARDANYRRDFVINQGVEEMKSRHGAGFRIKSVHCGDLNSYLIVEIDERDVSGE